MPGCSVFRRGSRYWVIVSRPGNKREWVSSFGTKDEALRLRNKILGEISSESYAAIKRVTFAEMADIWLERYPVLRGMKPSTIRDYRSAFRAHWVPAFGTRDLASITLDDLQRVVAGKLEAGLSKRRMADIIVPLKTMFRWAVRWNYLRVNPATDLQKPKYETPEMDWFTPEEAHRLIEALDPYWRPLFMTMFMTGVRPGEAIALRWKDIDLAHGLLNVRYTLDRGQLLPPKTDNARRRIPIPLELVEALEAQKAVWPANAQGLVFVQPGIGSPIDLSNFRQRVFHPALETAGLRRIRLYDIRHSYAAWMISLNVEPLQLSKNLGHFDLGFTYKTYGHTMPVSGHNEAARLGSLFTGAAPGDEVARETGSTNLIPFPYPVAVPQTARMQ
jgi:integrase